MNLEWRQPSKKLRFVLLDTAYADKVDYLRMGELGKVKARAQPDGSMKWEGMVYVRPTLHTPEPWGWRKQTFRTKHEAMAMVVISIKLENYDGFT